MSAVLLDGDAVRRLLTELVEELAADGVTGAVYVIGGAAVALIDDTRRSTTDIDGWLVASRGGTAAVSRVQQRWGLEADWFNFHANGLLPPVSGVDFFTPMHTVHDLTLFVAAAEALLAMKLFAARGKDQDDIAFLLRHCGVHDLDAAEAVFDRYYPGEGLSDTAIARVRAALDAHPAE